MRRVPAGPGGRAAGLGTLRGGQRPAARIARRSADARICPLLSGRPAVAHLTGYVGTPTAEQFKATHDQLLVTPGFKLGKDGLEKMLEPYLRGKPGAKRVEVTARGKVVAELPPGPTRPAAISA